MSCILGKVCPVTAYDKNGVRVLLHFATECPPGRPDVLVIVASMLNTAPQPVRSIVLQAAVPKVKLTVHVIISVTAQEATACAFVVKIIHLSSC